MDTKFYIIYTIRSKTIKLNLIGLQDTYFLFNYFTGDKYLRLQKFGFIWNE
jgi:hypothetical protein